MNGRASEAMGKKKRRKPEIGKVKVVKDFLPPPDQLVLREENVTLQGREKKPTPRRRAAIRPLTPFHVGAIPAPYHSHWARWVRRPRERHAQNRKSRAVAH